MITQIEGRLVAIVGGAAQVRVGDLTYEVLVPAADAMALSAGIGGQVVFHTLHYLEGQGQGSSFWPRLVGFRSVRDREFFELFTTVKGIGNRRALRALQMPFVRVARAVVERDLDTLQSLPEIGKRTAEAICVELKGKVDAFAHAGMPAAEPKGRAPAKARGGAAGASGVAANGVAADGTAAATAGAGGARAAAELAPVDDTGAVIIMANSAVEVLVQLGHTRVAARDLVERVLAREERPATAGELVTAALR